MTALAAIASILLSLKVIVGALAAIVGAHLATRQSKAALRQVVREEVAAAVAGEVAPVRARLAIVEKKLSSPAASPPVSPAAVAAGSRG